MKRVALGLAISLVALSLAGAATDRSLRAAQPATFSERWQQIAQATPARPKPAPAKPAAKPQQNLPVSLEQALYLIRSTLLTLNDANRSGNYSVLRDLAAPSFQAKNSPADLAQIFADLRNRHFDLFAVALAAPQLSTPPHLENNGMLRLTGYFPTRPLQINFDLLFENVAGQWRLFGISVQTTQAPPPAQAAAPKKP
jgi:hypothetical protein